jgi:hypothetical protein
MPLKTLLTIKETKMYVLNTQERTIKRFSNKDLSIWVNELIKYNRSLKSYLFMPTKKDATKFIQKQLKRA